MSKTKGENSVCLGPSGPEQNAMYNEYVMKHLTVKEIMAKHNLSDVLVTLRLHQGRDGYLYSLGIFDTPSEVSYDTFSDPSYISAFIEVYVMKNDQSAVLEKYGVSSDAFLYVTLYNAEYYHNKLVSIVNEYKKGTSVTELAERYELSTDLVIAVTRKY